ncbi:MAG: AbrB/MazE/SpoVT family DNA-binding domain-containing protein [Bifidobacteriaceae bacterium]|jgi:AbrB family looped-hinge helix DNA binding protein|nr:AbrB/MazE/SpoVT family DNA-binding domain-containing protein [Bifidobacteriaceae bacterium]
MDVATISANGQITLPVDVRKRLQLGSGDKVVFVENERGDTVVVRPSVAALLEAQRAFRGAAAEAGLQDEDDVQGIVDAVRYDDPNKRTV